MMRNACLSPAAIGLFLLCTASAHAQAGVSPREKTASEPTAQPAPLKDDELADFRGGQAITVANQTMTSIVSNASINGDVSAGAVSLSDNALSSFNGLGNVVINTGSQVSVQSGMNVTINVHQ